jgi:ATP-dependent RNA helicase DDX3X
MSDSMWAAGEMKSALPDLALAANGTATASAGRVVNEEAVKKAQDAGWVKPQPYDYSSTAPTAGINGTADTASKAEGEAGTGTNTASVHARSAWAHDAKKYEWKEEFGDIGPVDLALEKDLFQGEHINRAGAKLEKYVVIDTNHAVDLC